MAIKITRLYPANTDNAEYIEGALNELVSSHRARLISVQRQLDGLIWWVIYETDVSSKTK